MAYQPKSYRKFLATSVAAAMVATAAAPLATLAANDFSDVAAGTYYSDAVDYLVGNEVLGGFPDGSFKPNEGVTRAQAAKMLVESLGLEVPETVELAFTDTKDDAWYSGYVAALVNAGIVEGNPDGTFAPGATITRAALAKMVVEAYGLTADASAAVNFVDTVNGAWYEEYVTTLASLGIVQGTSATTFAPNATVTRAQSAVFLHRTEQPSVRVNPDSGVVDLQITGVSALTEDGHVLAVEFNKAPGNVTKGDVSIFNTRSLARVGVDSVQVYGNTAEITLYDDKDATEIQRLVEYTVNVDGNKFNFTRPGYLDSKRDTRVTKIDTKKNRITLSYDNNGISSWPTTLDVPADMEFDFEGVLGQEVKVWFDGEDNIVNFELEGNTVLYDAVEVTETLNATNNKGEIELDQAGDKYDLDDTVKLFLNGSEVTTGLVTELTDGKKIAYAKVILNEDGDVQYIYAYNWDASVIVEEVEDGIIYGYDEDLDTEDYVIVKDGKQISVEDIEAGDIVFYNATANNSLGEEGYIEVFNRTVSGEIEAVYDTSFKVDGKVYDYGAAESLDEDGDIQDFRDDEAKEMNGEVTVYLDRNGDVVFVSGAVSEVATNTSSAILTENLDTYENNKQDAMFTLEYLTSEGQEEVHEVVLKNLKSITIDGNEYEIDMDGAISSGEYSVTFNTGGALTNYTATAILLEKDAHLAAGDKTIANADKSVGIATGVTGTTVNALDNTAVKVEKDDNGNVIGLELFTSQALSADIEAGDTYAQTSSGAKKLSKDTLVYDISDSDPEDIKVYKYSDVAFDIKTSGTATVYYDGNDVEYVVFTDSDANKSELIATVITKALYDDGKLVYVKGYVDGAEKEFDVKKLSGVSLVKGDVVVLDFDASQDIVTAVDKAKTGFETNNLTVSSVDLSKKKVGTDGGTFTLTSDAQVIDASGSDYKVKALRDLDGLTKKITVVRDENGSGYVDTIVIQAGTLAGPAALNSGAAFTEDSDGATATNNVTFTDNATTTADTLDLTGLAADVATVEVTIGGVKYTTTATSNAASVTIGANTAVASVDADVVFVDGVGRKSAATTVTLTNIANANTLQ